MEKWYKGRTYASMQGIDKAEEAEYEGLGAYIKVPKAIYEL